MIHVAPSVTEAREAGRPVVVLESTVLAQGLPYPHNLEAARRTTAAVEGAGAVAATVAVIRGCLHVGLVEEEIRRVAESELPKVSARDLAIVMANGGDGALTVSASVAAARLARIRVVSTGGIGGVHRNWSETLDISSDLAELGRSPVVVVASGVKSVLDIPATLEALETVGIPVLGFGTDAMPGFLVRDTGHVLEYSMADAAAVADMLHVQWGVLGRSAGALVCNPIPREHCLERAMVEEAVLRAVSQADAAGITGKETTPFLLRRLDTLTGGASLEANLALLEDNARVAAEIAVALAERHPAL